VLVKNNLNFCNGSLGGLGPKPLSGYDPGNISAQLQCHSRRYTLANTRQRQIKNRQYTN